MEKNPQTPEQPFFARFLEDQEVAQASGACPCQTHKYPSDIDEEVTHKYPSDDDENS